VEQVSDSPVGVTLVASCQTEGCDYTATSMATKTAAAMAPIEDHLYDNVGHRLRIERTDEFYLESEEHEVWGAPS